MLNAVSNLIQTQQIPLQPVTGPTEKAGKTGKPAAPAQADKSTGLGEDRYVSYGRLAGLAAGGGFAAYKLGNQTATHFQELAAALKTSAGAGGSFQAALPALQKIGLASMKGAGLSAMVTAGVSAISNGVGVARGKFDGQTAVQNVISDSIGGAIGGFGAVTAAGAGTMLLQSFGMVGLPLTIGTVAFGALGGVSTGMLAQKLQNSQKNS